MFDLDTEVAAWSAALGNGCENGANAAELEDHLLTEIERLTAAGEPPERAFRSAVEKIGNTAALAAEYDKNRPFGARLYRAIGRFEHAWASGRLRERTLGHALLGASFILATSIVMVGLDVTPAVEVAGLLLSVAVAWTFVSVGARRRT